MMTTQLQKLSDEALATELERRAHEGHDRAERRAAAAARHVEAFARFERLEPASRERQASAKAALEKARAAFDEAAARARAAYFQYVGLSESRDREVAHAQADLRETAPDCYSRALVQLDQIFEGVRRLGRNATAASATARMRAIAPAREKIYELMDTPAEDVDAERHVGAIVAGLPELEPRE